MKKFRVLIFILLMGMTLTSVYAQPRNLKRMSEKKRYDYMYEQARDLVMKYGPSYWHDDLQGTIYGPHRNIPHPWHEDEVKKKRMIYHIRLRYDYPDGYYGSNWYGSTVYFWADTGEPFIVGFPTASFYLEESEDKEYGINGKYKVVPPKQIPPFPF